MESSISTGEQRSRLPSLTGARIIAALMVFGFHASLEGLFRSPVATTVFGTTFRYAGLVGVSFFFVLSGFILTWSKRPTDTPRSFWRRRFFKIFPNHVVTLIVAAILLTMAGAVITNQQVLLNLFLLQAWSPDLLVVTSLNSVAWSLSCEALFYLWFPFWIRYIERIRPERLWAWTAAVGVAIFMVPVVSMALPDQPALPGQPGSTWQFWFIYILPLTRMLDFVLGIMLARIVLTGRTLPVSPGIAVALAVGMYWLTPFFPWGFTLVAIMVVPLGLVIASVAVADIEGRRTWLASRPMVWLGEVSFAFYLWHWMVVVFGHKYLDGRNWDTPAALGIVGLLFGVTLLLSWLLFTFWERPIMRRFASERKRPAPVPASPASVG